MTISVACLIACPTSLFEWICDASKQPSQEHEWHEYEFEEVVASGFDVAEYDANFVTEEEDHDEYEGGDTSADDEDGELTFGQTQETVGGGLHDD